MALLVAVCTLLLAALVVWVLSGPLRRAGVIGARRDAERRPAPGAPGERLAADAPDDPAGADPDLQAAREVKYREIREAELDYRTGKLSESDHRAIDAELRAQALELLDEIERRRERREQR